MPLRKHPWTVRTEKDDLLLQRSHLERFAVTMVRKRLWDDYSKLPERERRRLVDNGPKARFGYLNHLLRVTWGVMGEWEWWLKYLEHSEQDIHEMERGEYPISPHLIRIYSALFGIKVDFLLLGNAPELDRIGANIDAWPLSGIR